MSGISFALTDEQLELQAIARAFAYEEVRPVARRLDREQDPSKTFPRELFRRASALGLRTLTLPRELGGRDADALTQAIVLEELCAGDCGFGMSLVHAWREGLALATLTTPAQRERHLPDFLAQDDHLTSLGMTEPHAGSDHVLPYDGPGAGTQTTAVLDGDEWVINGTKKWISNANVSRTMFLLARTCPDGPWTDAVSLFVLAMDRPGLRVGHVEDKLGLRLNQNAQIFFEDCRIPADSLMGELHQGRVMLGRLGKGSMLKEAIKSLGIARAAYEEARSWTAERVQGGRPIAEHQSVGAKLVEMATGLEVVRSMIWRAAWATEHDPERGPALEAMVKVHAGEVAARIAIDALELHGAYGVIRDNHVEKLVRDAVTMLHAFGGNHAVRARVSGMLDAFDVGVRPLAAA